MCAKKKNVLAAKGLKKQKLHGHTLQMVFYICKAPPGFSFISPTDTVVSSRSSDLEEATGMEEMIRGVRGPVEGHFGDSSIAGDWTSTVDRYIDSSGREDTQDKQSLPWDTFWLVLF